MYGNDWWNRYVFSRKRSRRRMTEYHEVGRSNVSIGNERRPTVAIDEMPESAASA